MLREKGYLQKLVNRFLVCDMQAIEGGTSQGGMVGGSGNIGVAPAPGHVVQFGMKTADNLNPQAPDCYFYYYSNCAKVRESLWRLTFLFQFHLYPGLLLHTELIVSLFIRCTMRCEI